MIILEDLKHILRCRISDVRDKLNKLSADWQTLDADAEGWEDRFPDPQFLGAWREHRKVFGYTLRSELVYQLKHALEQTGNLSLETQFSYLLVDEYQDLNRCDLALIQALGARGIEIFGAGDDDQSIYGFRYAHPGGIRSFDSDFVPSRSLDLSTCVRCDRSIIEFSSFVANLDPRRLSKPLEPRPDAENGEVHLLRFGNQNLEATGIARLCKYLQDQRAMAGKDVLILMRSDRHGAFSSLIREALERENVPVAIRAEGTPVDTEEGRVFLSFLRLIADDADSLALRTLLQLRENQVGGKSCSAVYDLARQKGETFSQSVRRVAAEPELVSRLGGRISREAADIWVILDRHRERFDALITSSEADQLQEALHNLAEDVILDVNVRKEVLDFLYQIAAETESTDHKELLQALSSSLGDQEQELDPNCVNIMTMHKAKGLTADAVVVLAAEDEYIPGRQTGEREGDERRLLYVSLTRARHFLAVTYCDQRTGRQMHTGRSSGDSRRTLTRFLVDAPVIPADGVNFLEHISLSSG